MPTLAGLRRRGYTPEAIRDFAERIGVAKADNLVDIAHLEHCLREDLNRRTPRVMAVLRPLKLVIENYREGQVEEVEAVNNPEDPAMGTRRVPFSRVLWIEQDDFRETPPPKYFLLSPDAEVRLRYAYLVKCTGVVKDPRTGEVTVRRLPVRPPGLLRRRRRGLLPVAPGLQQGGRPPGRLREDREGGPLGGAPPRPHAVITPNVATPRSSRPAGRRAGMPTRALPVDRA